MLVAVLNCCTKEELEEEEEEAEEETAIPTSPVIQEERRKVIKNKILAVGRISRVFQLLRCVSPSQAITITKLI
jgi:serine/threonine-protein phosphatase 2B catalytic subunit